jgi:hypothetical protein
MPGKRKRRSPVPRRDFRRLSAAVVGAMGAAGIDPAYAAVSQSANRAGPGAPATAGADATQPWGRSA